MSEVIPTLNIYQALDERALQHARRLDALNARFYQEYASAFHQTRSVGWRGWRQLLDLLPDQPLMVYDIACGNGRLSQLLSQVWCEERGREVRGYLGLDRDQALLAYAREHSAPWASEWREWSWSSPEQQPHTPLGLRGADWVTIFGVMHHIYRFEARVEIIAWASQLLSPGGVLSVSLWDFGSEERYQKKRLDWGDISPPLASELIEEGDWLLGWRGAREVPRYCHWMSRAEESRWLKEVSHRAPHLSRPQLTTHPYDGNRYWSWRRDA